MLPTPSPFDHSSMSHSHLTLSRCETKRLPLPLRPRSLSGFTCFTEWYSYTLHCPCQKPAHHPGQLPSHVPQPHHEARSILPHALGHLHPPLHISAAAIICYLDNHKSHLPGPPWSAPPSQPILRTAARKTFFIFLNKHHSTSFP